MSPDELARHLSSVLRPIVKLVQADPAARDALHALSRWLADQCRSDDTTVNTTCDADGSNVDSISHSPSQTKVSVLADPLQQIDLIIGDQRHTVEVPGTTQEAEAARRAADLATSAIGRSGQTVPYNGSAHGQTMDMALVAQRCCIKAEGCEWAMRHSAHYEPDDLQARAMYKDIINRARSLPGCYVWAINPAVIKPTAAVLSKFATAYLNLAKAAVMAQRAHEDHHAGRGEDWRTQAYRVLAEAQSAIRFSLEREGLFTDPDQESAFFWLRTRTQEDRILVPRHMRIDDPANIADSSELKQRLHELDQHIAMRLFHDAQRRQLFKKAEYHARKIRDHDSDNPAADWRTFMETIGAMVERGAAPSEVEIRETVLPIVDHIPDDLQLPPPFALVLREIDRYIASREEVGDEKPRSRAITPELAEAAELLQDTTVVLIGGDRRPQSQRALERELRLKELRWESSLPHESHYVFEPAIARQETSVVLLAIRWSSHSFENVRSLCERYAKPFVRLPTGYSPNQVAAQIMMQVGDTLRKYRHAAN